MPACGQDQANRGQGWREGHRSEISHHVFPTLESGHHRCLWLVSLLPDDLARPRDPIRSLSGWSGSSSAPTQASLQTGMIF